MYFPTMTSKQNKLDELIDRYIAKVPSLKPKNARNTQQHLLWWKTQLGNLSHNKISADVISQIFDIIATKIPSLDVILDHMSTEIDEVYFYFSPDLLLI